MNQILEAMRAQSWQQVKAHLTTIQAVDYPPDTGKSADYKEWDTKCQKRRKIFDSFVKAVEEEELWK